ncbi:hypothetical protein KM759_gp146 [Lymphocystis disease virus 4]|uniref:Uncharacterized protein n=1 Tax=Lymphocystis disease virus 4 TaxID=2704413 RepID=A0A6B9XL75_9VIRU|nr:hypothetical protein KM759_gp146 [Lymphocystis disease virus 4]QHR78549.1 hypothetical protein [Lymphocystis disease virus 4]
MTLPLILAIFNIIKMKSSVELSFLIYCLPDYKYESMIEFIEKTTNWKSDLNRFLNYKSLISFFKQNPVHCVNLMKECEQIIPMYTDALGITHFFNKTSSEIIKHLINKIFEIFFYSTN